MCNRTIYCTEFGAICVSSTHILFLPLIGNLTVSRKCVSETTIQSLLLFWRSPSYQDHVEIWMLLQNRSSDHTKALVLFADASQAAKALVLNGVTFRGEVLQVEVVEDYDS